MDSPLSTICQDCGVVAGGRSSRRALSALPIENGGAPHPHFPADQPPSIMKLLPVTIADSSAAR
jgi:hypothetical protein